MVELGVERITRTKVRRSSGRNLAGRTLEGQRSSPGASGRCQVGAGEEGSPGASAGQTLLLLQGGEGPQNISISCHTLPRWAPRFSLACFRKGHPRSHWRGLCVKRQDQTKQRSKNLERNTLPNTKKNIFICKYTIESLGCLPEINTTW